MAIVYKGIKCPLCGEEIDIEADFFATSDGYLPGEPDISRYYDAALHWECYETWPHRQRFAAQYVKLILKAANENEYWYIVAETPDYFVKVNPDDYVSRVDIVIYETGSSISVSLKIWDEWIRDPQKAVDYLYPLEANALSRIFPDLETRLPNSKSILTEARAQGYKQS